KIVPMQVPMPAPMTRKAPDSSHQAAWVPTVVTTVSSRPVPARVMSRPIRTRMRPSLPVRPMHAAAARSRPPTGGSRARVAGTREEAGGGGGEGGGGGGGGGVEGSLQEQGDDVVQAAEGGEERQARDQAGSESLVGQESRLEQRLSGGDLAPAETGEQDRGG